MGGDPYLAGNLILIRPGSNMRDIDRFYARTPGEEYTWSRLLSPEA